MAANFTLFHNTTLNHTTRSSSSTESYWTIVETVPYTLASSQTSGGNAPVTNVISAHSHHQHHQVQQQPHTTIHHHQQHQQTSQQQQHQHQPHVATGTDASNLITSATVVVEIPSDTVGMPGSTIHYTLPKATTTTDHQQILRNVQTSTALTAAYTKLANTPATIQIVKQTPNNPQHHNASRITTSEANLTDVQHTAQTAHQQVQHITLQECLDATTTNVLQQQQQQQHQHNQHHHAPAHHIQQTTTTIGGNNQQHSTVAQIQQEYIKIDTARFEDKVLLRNVVQYEQQHQHHQHHQQQQHQTVTISTTPTTTSAGTQATIIVNEASATHKDLQRHQQEHLVQQPQQQHEQLLAESVTTSASEADDLDDLAELKPLVTNHNIANSNATNTSSLLPPPPPPPTSHHDTSESDSEKFLTPHSKRIKTSALKPSEIAGLQYVCNVCGKSYKIKGSLKRHKSYECGVAPGLSCPYCPHKCKYKSDLRKHISQKHALNITTTTNNLTI